MKENQRPRYLFFTAVSLLVVLFFCRVVCSWLSAGDYVVIHFILESLNVFLLLGIASALYHDQNGIRTSPFFSALFLAAALLNFFHLASYPGMPHFITPNTTEKALLLGGASRLNFGLAVVAYMVFPRWRFCAWRSKFCGLLASAAFAVGFLGLLLLGIRLFSLAAGSTPEAALVQKTAECLVIGLLLLALALARKSWHHPTLFLGITLSVAAAAFLVFCRTHYDYLNLAGHLLQVCAAAYLFGHFLLRSIREPFRQMEEIFVTAMSHFAEHLNGNHRMACVQEHCRRVAAYAREIAAELDLSSEEKEQVYRAALIHDLGKLALPGQVWHQGDASDRDGIQLGKKHPEIAARTLGSGGGDGCLRGVMEHHERLDGSGFPMGLKGSQISIYGRILAVADSFDTLTAAGPGERGLKSALERLVAESCHKLDRECVAGLIRALQKGRIEV